MESQEIYSDDNSYHSSQDSNCVFDIQDDYSDSSGDIYDRSFIDGSELDDDAYYFDDQRNIRNFMDSNIAEAEEELQNIKYILRQPRIKPNDI